MVGTHLVRNTPFEQLQNQMNRWLGDAWGSEFPLSGVFAPRTPMNVWETDDAFHVELELPGIPKESLEISVFDRQLTLRVNRSNETEEEKRNYLRRELSSESFSRMVELPIDIDSEAVNAELKDGVLTVTLPKTARSVPRKIEIE